MMHQYLGIIAEMAALSKFLYIYIRVDKTV